VIGYVILVSVITQEVYAVLFGLVCEMMIMVSMKELIPTAHRYDPEGTVVTTCIIAGMALMVLSLLLFKISTPI
jgi:ZIP family zinc transporter